MMTAISWVRFLAVGLAGMALVACGATSDAEADDETPITEDELRRRSEDLYKPTTAPIQTVPSTLKGIERWDLFQGESGNTVIGWSKSKKRKAIYVMLVDRLRDDAANVRGSGYLMASDFRLDARNHKNELKLLAEAIRKDFTPAVDAVPVATEPAAPPPANEPLVAAEPEPTPSPASEPPAASTPPASPPAPSPDPKKEAPKACVKSTLKLILFGLKLVRDVTDVALNATYCHMNDDKSACAAAVASFEHGLYLSTTYKDVMCKR